jgi:hypothetical protein
MKTNFGSRRRIAAALVLATGALAGCAGFATAPSPALRQQIEAARTPADHQALAKHYVAEADAARAKAAEHRRMSTSYQGMIGGGRGGGSMAAHCNALASSFDGIAAQFDAMAASHRQMAEQAKP